MARDQATTTDHGFAWRSILVALCGLPNIEVSLGGRREPVLTPEATLLVTLQHGHYRFNLSPGHDGVAQVKRATARSSRAVKYDSVVGSVLATASKEDAAESMKAAADMRREAEAKEREELYGRTLNALRRLAAPLFWRGDPTHYGNVAFVRNGIAWGSYECRVDVEAGRMTVELQWDVNPTMLEQDPSYGDNAPVRVAAEEMIRTLLRCQAAYAEKFPPEKKESA